ncbi:MAG TPA: gas vesicle protein GvpJ, partial [Actinophytocola sp.]
MDKGLVLDAYVRVALVGIEVLTIDVRVVIASIDTYLEFADAVDRLNLSDTEPRQLTDLLDEVTEGPIGARWGVLGMTVSGGRTSGGDTIRGGSRQVYVYGIVPSDVETTPDARGVGDPPYDVLTVRHGEVAA